MAKLYFKDMLTGKEQSFSYYTSFEKAKKQILSLDKQLFFHDLSNIFEGYTNSQEHILKFTIITNTGFSHDNPYEPKTSTEFRANLSFKIPHKSENNADYHSNSLINFINYVSNENQYKIYYWLIKIFEENKLIYNKENVSAEFPINENIIEIILKEAYEDKYAEYLQQKLEKSIPKNETKGKKHFNKI